MFKDDHEKFLYGTWYILHMVLELNKIENITMYSQEWLFEFKMGFWMVIYFVNNFQNFLSLDMVTRIACRSTLY